jgi:ribosomal protein S18 acetylase RimI-like enzyme
MFQNMLLNERSFDKLFCDVSSTNRFDVYYNRSFSDDPVFNHVVIDDSILGSIDELDRDSLSVLLYEIKSEASAKNVPPTVFVEKFWKIAQRLERAAIEDGYLIAGLMQILSKQVDAVSNSKEKQAEVIETKNFALWNEVFMRSYSLSPAWESELLRRERVFSNDRSTTLLLARESNSGPAASGCMLLHRIPNDFLGVYCVGTLPQSRHRGIASSMMRKAEDVAASIGCKYLTLQTLANDGVTPLYQNLGFEIDFERTVLQLP